MFNYKVNTIMTEFFSEFILFCVQTAISYVIIKFLINVVAHHTMIKNHIMETTLRRISDIIHPVKIEKEGDMMYWYDAENGSFIAQGRTREEIIAILRTQWTKHIFLLEENQEILVGPDFTSMPTHSLTK